MKKTELSNISKQWRTLRNLTSFTLLALPIMTYKIGILLTTYSNGNASYSVPFALLKEKGLNDNIVNLGDCFK